MHLSARFVPYRSLHMDRNVCFNDVSFGLLSLCISLKEKLLLETQKETFPSAQKMLVPETDKKFPSSKNSYHHSYNER